MKKISIIILSSLFLFSCSYNPTVGKKCMDSEYGGQSWSFLWFVQKDVEFDKCNES